MSLKDFIFVVKLEIINNLFNKVYEYELERNESRKYLLYFKNLVRVSLLKL